MFWLVLLSVQIMTIPPKVVEVYKDQTKCLEDAKSRNMERERWHDSEDGKKYACVKLIFDA